MSRNHAVTHEWHGMVIDTHTAVAVKVAVAHLHSGVPMIVLESALPVKFTEAIVEGIGIEPALPPKFIGIESLPKRVTNLSANVSAIKRFIAKKCA